MSTEAQHFIDLLSPYIHSCGYWVAFSGMMLENAGIPVPAETVLIALSFFAGQGVLKIWLVIPIAILGDTTGDNMGFLIGKLGGRPLVEKYGRYVRIDKAKLDAMEALFKEKGGRTVFSARSFTMLIVGNHLLSYVRSKLSVTMVHGSTPFRLLWRFDKPIVIDWSVTINTRLRTQDASVLTTQLCLVNFVLCPRLMWGSRLQVVVL